MKFDKWSEQIKSKYLEIINKGSKYIVRNKQQDVTIGVIEKMRVGRFMHWVLSPQPGTYFTNGCLKEISKFITNLYGKERNM